MEHENPDGTGKNKVLFPAAAAAAATVATVGPTKNYPGQFYPQFSMFAKLVKWSRGPNRLGHGDYKGNLQSYIWG